jgi:hypothetical protein
MVEEAVIPAVVIMAPVTMTVDITPLIMAARWEHVITQRTTVVDSRLIHSVSKTGHRTSPHRHAVK